MKNIFVIIIFGWSGVHSFHSAYKLERLRMCQVNKRMAHKVDSDNIPNRSKKAPRPSDISKVELDKLERLGYVYDFERGKWTRRAPPREHTSVSIVVGERKLDLININQKEYDAANRLQWILLRGTARPDTLQDIVLRNIVSQQGFFIFWMGMQAQLCSCILDLYPYALDVGISQRDVTESLIVTIPVFIAMHMIWASTWRIFPEGPRLIGRLERAMTDNLRDSVAIPAARRDRVTEKSWRLYHAVLSFFIAIPRSLLINGLIQTNLEHWLYGLLNADAPLYLENFGKDIAGVSAYLSITMIALLCMIADGYISFTQPISGAIKEREIIQQEIKYDDTSFSKVCDAWLDTYASKDETLQIILQKSVRAFSVGGKAAISGIAFYISGNSIIGPLILHLVECGIDAIYLPFDEDAHTHTIDFGDSR